MTWDIESEEPAGNDWEVVGEEPTPKPPGFLDRAKQFFSGPSTPAGAAPAPTGDPMGSGAAEIMGVAGDGLTLLERPMPGYDSQPLTRDQAIEMSKSPETVAREEMLRRSLQPIGTVKALGEESGAASLLRRFDRKPLDGSLLGAAGETAGDAARGLAKTGPGLAKSAWGGVQAVGDVVGADRLASFAGDAQRAGDGHLAQFDNPNGDRLVTGAFQSLGSAALGGAVGGSAGAITLGVGQTAGDKYGELRRAGLGVGDSLEAATVHGVAEYLGERVGMKSLGRMVDAISSAKGLPAREALREALKQQGEEQVTLAIQSAYDKVGSGSLRNDMTWQDYLDDVVDTSKQTAIMTAAAAGGGRLAKAIPVPRREPEPATPFQPVTDARNVFEVPQAQPAPIDAPAARQRAAQAAAATKVELQPTTPMTPEEILSAPPSVPLVPEQGKGGQDDPGRIDVEDPSAVLGALGLGGPPAARVPAAGGGPVGGGALGGAGDPGLAQGGLQPAPARVAPGAAVGGPAAVPVDARPGADAQVASTDGQAAAQARPAGAALPQRAPGVVAAAERVDAIRRHYESSPRAADLPTDIRGVEDPQAVAAFDALSGALAGITGTPRVEIVESDDRSFDGLNFDGRAVVNLNGLQKPAVFVAGHEASHTWQDLVEQGDPDAVRIIKPMEDAIWEMIPQGARDAYARDVMGIDPGIDPGVDGGLTAGLAATVVRREMLADFHGRRLSDPQTVGELARRQPAIFGDYARRVIDMLNTAIGKLRGSKNGIPANQNIDRMVADLQKAKAVWIDAMLAWQKRGGKDAAAVAQPGLDGTSAAQPLAAPKVAASRRQGESDKAFAKRVVDKRPRPTALPENHGLYFNRPDGTVDVPLENLISLKTDSENVSGRENGLKRMQAAAAGELPKRDPISVMPSKSRPGSYEIVDGNGTFTGARDLGWKSLPVTVMDRASGERSAKIERAADSAEPYVGEAMVKEMLRAIDGADETPKKQRDAAKLAEAQRAVTPLIARAEEINGEFEGRVRGVAKAIGAEPSIGPVKKAGRAAEKYYDDVFEDGVEPGDEVVKDLVRASIIVRSEAEVRAAVEAVKREFNVTRTKDRFETPLPTGYRDVLLNIRLENGTIGEVQIHVPGIYAAKDLGHMVYEIERQLPIGSEPRAGLLGLQNRYYGKAYENSDSNSSRDATQPSLMAREASNGLPDRAYKYRAPDDSVAGTSSTGIPSTSNSLTPGLAASARQSNASIATSKADTPIVNQGRLEEPAPLYVSRKVVSGAELVLWAKSVGIKDVVPADKMHVTIAYSKAPVDSRRMGQADAAVTVERGRRTIERLGDGGKDIVLRFDSPELQSRFAELKSLGASWDHGDQYLPHVTLSYDNDQPLDLEKIQPFPLPIRLGAEKAEDLKEGWRPDDAPPVSRSGREKFEVVDLPGGRVLVKGEADDVRAMLPDGIRGRATPDGVLFTNSDAPRARAALEGRKLAYSRGGQVIDDMPMKDGKYLGAPPGYDTPKTVGKLRKWLGDLAAEGDYGRYWYENSGKAVLQMVGGDLQEARRLVALLAIYSPQAKVDANSTFALRAWAQYKAGHPISVKTAVMDRKAQEALDDVDAFWSGEKTGNFFNNLLRSIDPSTADMQGATIDMWMMRAGRYPTDAPTKTQYAFMENETNRVARELGWEPQQVQAAIWVAMKARMENSGVKKRTEDSSEKAGWIRFDYPLKNGRPMKTRVILDARAHRDNWLKKTFEYEPNAADKRAAKFDFGDGLRRHIGQVSWEARPGRSTGVLPGVNDASYERQVEFQQAAQKALLGENGEDLLANRLGLLVDGEDILAPGVWQGEVAAGMQKQIVMAPAKGDDGKRGLDDAQKKALDTYSMVLGWLLRQEGVGWHRPFYTTTKGEQNGVELRIGRPLSADEAKQLWSAIDERMRAAGVSDWESGAGMISSPEGMRLVNFGAMVDNGLFRNLVKDAAGTLVVDQIEVGAFASDGNLVTNDWKESPSGEDYRQGIAAAGRPDLLEWAGAVLAPRVQAVFDEFSSKYGWGDAGRISLSRRREEDAEGQRAHLDRRAKELGHADLDAFVRDDYEGFVEEAASWRDQHPAEVSFSRRDDTVIAYHGSKADIESFDPSRARRLAAWGKAVYVAEDASAASRYADTEGGAIYKLIVRPGKVLDLVDGFKPADLKRVQAAISKMGGKGLAGYLRAGYYPENAVSTALGDMSDKSRVAEAIQLAGYDSVRYPLQDDGTEVSLAVFDPRRLKSATGNRGTFDPADPRISYSRRAPDSEAFKRWFGDSKVVDKYGSPLVAYHGTNASFDAFDIDGANEIGSWFAAPAKRYGDSQSIDDARAAADNFAATQTDLYGGADTVMPVYLSIKNPRVFRGYGAFERWSGQSADGKAMRERLQADGYDGIVIRGSTTDSGELRDDWVAFGSAQIKSAIGNDGGFDPTNLSISRSGRRAGGFIDEMGRLKFAPGAAAYARIAPAVKSALARVGLNPIDPALKRKVREMQQAIEASKVVAQGVASESFKMSDADRELISDIVEGELKAGIAPPQHALRMAAGIQQIMDQQTNDLVALGMLSQDAADRWRGSYLPRFYRSKLMQAIKDPWNALLSQMGRKPSVMQGIKGKSLKGRGMWETIEVRYLPDWEAIGWQVRDQDYEPATARKKDSVQIWRDFTREERDKMGEIRDAGFRFTMGYLRTQRDIALGKLFQSIASDADMSSKNERPGWVQVPDGSLEGTGGVKRYGKLAGRWVPREVMTHLANYDQGENEALRLYRKALSMWKEGKTVLNPVSHANNVMSNVSMAHFAGVSYWDVNKYAGAILDLARGVPLVDEARKAGLFLGTMTQEELLATMPKELRALAAIQASKAEVAADKVWDMLALWLRRPAGVAYEAEDQFFRYLIYRDARERGLAPQDAVDYSQRYIFTYDDLPQTARRIRDFGIPFFAYTYKAIPALLHTAAHYPWRFAAPAALMWSINAAMYAIAAGDDDEDNVERVLKFLQDKERREKTAELEKRERAALPPWMRGNSTLFSPKAVRLGIDEVTGLPLFWDTAQIMPGGNMFDLENNAHGIPWFQSLTPSNPLFTTMMAMFFNTDAFRGKDIVDTNDTSAEATMKRVDWLYKQLAPAIAIGNYHSERAANVVAQVTGEPVAWLPNDATGFSKDGLPVQPGLAAMQTVGIKVRPIDIEMAEEMLRGQSAKMIREIDAEIRRLRRLNANGAISDSNLEREMERAQEKKSRLREGLTVDGEERQ